jgi:hypothetical protein
VPPVFPEYVNVSFTNLGNVTSDRFGLPAQALAGRIDFAGATVLSGQTVHFRNIRIALPSNAQEGDVFYLKQIPTPEPTALAVILLGGLVLLRRRGRC